MSEYARSKFKAERGLRSIAAGCRMEVVILRPPLVYGPNAKGNFANLVRLTNLGIPLPLSKIKNKRAFISIDNLVHLVITCLDHPKAANQIFLASDDHDMSTTEFINHLAKAFGKPSRLFYFPTQLLVAVSYNRTKCSVSQPL